MVRTLSLARRAGAEEILVPGSESLPPLSLPRPGTCAHRTVARDGRIVCTKIVAGDPEVSPNVCRTCPYKAVNCAHLHFSLRLTSPSPLIVRFNGRTELWDDGPAELRFERAACALRVAPLPDARACAACALRQAVAGEPGAGEEVAGGRAGKVVPFPGREALLAAGRGGA